MTTKRENKKTNAATQTRATKRPSKAPQTALSPVDVPAPPLPQTRLSVPAVAIYLSKGYTQSAIARVFNVTKQSVSQFIERHADELADLKDYDQTFSTKLKHLAIRTAQSIDADTIKKARFGERVLGIAQLVDKVRLIEGDSTQNVQFFGAFHAAIYQPDTLKNLLESGESEGEGVKEVTNETESARSDSSDNANNVENTESYSE